MRDRGGRGAPVYRVGTWNPLGFAPGDLVHAIDGRTPEQLLADVAAQPRCFIGASTAAQARATLVASILFRASTDAMIDVGPAATPEASEARMLQTSPTFANWLACDGRVGVPDAAAHAYGIATATLASDGGPIAYVRLPMFGGYDAAGNFVSDPVIDTLRECITAARDQRGLILDLRGNPGGAPAVYLALASWLYAEPTPLFRCANKRGDAHDDFDADYDMTAVPDPTLQLAGPVAVLVDARSFSAADFSSAFLHLTGRARTFGAPSGGGFGAGNSFAKASRGSVSDPEARLPATSVALSTVAPALGAAASWTLGFSDIRCTDLEGHLLEGHPPAVDVPVAYTREDLRAGGDTVIEAARAWIATTP